MFRAAPAAPLEQAALFDARFQARTGDPFALKTLEDCTPASGPVNEPRTVAGRLPAAASRRGL